MITILFRTLLIYGFLILIMRLMGKRQLGELEVSDFVTTLIISEIAALPLTNSDIPITHALLPVLILAALEMGLSALLLKRPEYKRILIPRPAVLICQGIPDRTAMHKARISCEELLSQLRLQGINDFDAIACAVLEPNGQISIIAETDNETVSAENKPCGMMYLLISDGYINRKNLKLVNKDVQWLHDYLRERGMKRQDVFMLLADDRGCLRLYPKKEKNLP